MTAIFARTQGSSLAVARKPSLLLVDDESSVLLTLSMVLESDGYSVTTASSAAEALALMRAGKTFDILVTDVCLEREDIGLKVARHAFRLRPRPIIVLITGFASIENAREALEMHVDYYALKPLDLDELRSALNRLISARHAASQHAAC